MGHCPMLTAHRAACPMPWESSLIRACHVYASGDQVIPMRRGARVLDAVGRGQVGASLRDARSRPDKQVFGKCQGPPGKPAQHGGPWPMLTLRCRG